MFCSFGQIFFLCWPIIALQIVKVADPWVRPRSHHVSPTFPLADSFWSSRQKLRIRGKLCELFKDMSWEGHQCTADAPRISSRLNIWTCQGPAGELQPMRARTGFEDRGQRTVVLSAVWMCVWEGEKESDKEENDVSVTPCFHWAVQSSTHPHISWLFLHFHYERLQMVQTELSILKGGANTTAVRWLVNREPSLCSEVSCDRFGNHYSYGGKFTHITKL